MRGAKKGRSPFNWEMNVLKYAEMSLPNSGSVNWNQLMLICLFAEVQTTNSNLIDSLKSNVVDEHQHNFISLI